MSKQKNKQKNIVFEIIFKAVNGNAIEVNIIVDHYARYITKLSTIVSKDKNGNYYKYVDEDMRRQLETKLITKMQNFKLV